MSENDVKRIVCDSMAVPFEAVDSNPAVEAVNEQTAVQYMVAPTVFEPHGVQSIAQELTIPFNAVHSAQSETPLQAPQSSGTVDSIT